jgi:hypothetical protein
MNGRDVLESQLRKVRCISYESAMVDLDERGHPHPKPFAHVPEGLAGDCVKSQLYLVDGLVWEVAHYHNQTTRVYMHDPEDLQENERFNSYA